MAYKIFVHAYDANGRRLAQHDSEPGQGEFPTSGWLAGEYIIDAHELVIEDTAEVKTLWIGLYDPDSGQRLPLLDAGDHLVLTPAWDTGK